MKKLIVAGIVALGLALTGCGANNGVDNNTAYCDGNVYTAIDEDDYTCSQNGVVYFHGDHEDDSKKKGAHGPAGSGGWFSKPKASTKPNNSYKAPAYKAPAYKAPAYKAPSSSGSKSYSYKK